VHKKPPNDEEGERSNLKMEKYVQLIQADNCVISQTSSVSPNNNKIELLHFLQLFFPSVVPTCPLALTCNFFIGLHIAIALNHH
jgi:hypothetical protein